MRGVFRYIPRPLVATTALLGVTFEATMMCLLIPLFAATARPRVRLRCMIYIQWSPLALTSILRVSSEGSVLDVAIAGASIL